MNTGIGSGAATGCVPLYVAEISPTSEAVARIAKNPKYLILKTNSTDSRTSKTLNTRHKSKNKRSKSRSRSRSTSRSISPSLPKPTNIF